MEAMGRVYQGSVIVSVQCHWQSESSNKTTLNTYIGFTDLKFISGQLSLDIQRTRFNTEKVWGQHSRSTKQSTLPVESLNKSKIILKGLKGYERF